MTPLSALFAAMAAADDGYTVTIPPDWQQGRTTYGGLTAALCVAAAMRAEADLPSLCSAQFAFVGPAGGPVRVTPKTLRRGKNTVFMAVDLTADPGLATHATLVFGAPRQSSLSYGNMKPPVVPAPEDSPSFFGGFPGPVFSQHFDYQRAGGHAPRSGADSPEYQLWLRHTDRSLGGSIPALIAIADAPPPAAMAMFKEFGPISTITWSMDVFDVPAAHGAPWHLMTCRSERVANGYSTQEMAVWSQDGEPLMLARQNIAIFV